MGNLSVLLWPVAGMVFVLELFYLYRGFRCVAAAGVAAARGLWRRWRNILEPIAEDPQILAEAASLLARRRGEAARIVTYAMWTIGAFLGLVVMTQVVRKTAVSEVSVILQGLFFLVLSLAGGFTSLAASFRSQGALHVTIMAVLILFAVLVRVPGDANFAKSSLIMTMSLVSGGLCLRWPLLFVTNACLYVAIILSRIEDGSNSSPVITIGLESVNLFVKLGLFYVGEYLVEFSARKEAEARLGKCNQSAVTSLLDMLCDAVVDMDGSLRLKSHCPKLSGIFFLNAGRSLQDCSFVDVIQEGDDRAKFQEIVQRSTQGEEALVSSMLTVRMRDSVGNPVKMGLYHVPYTAVDDCTHHLVGLREDMDLVSAFGQRKENGATGAVLKPDIANELYGDVLGPAAMIRRRSTRSSHSHGSGNSGGSTEKQSAKLRRVCVYLEPELPIVEASARFWQAVGLTAGQNTGRIKTFGECFEDDGCQIIDTLKVLLSTECRDSMHSLGEMEMVDWNYGYADVGSRRLWAQFLPVEDEQCGRRRVHISISPRVAGTGTAASIAPQPLGASTSGCAAEGSVAL